MVKRMRPGMTAAPFGSTNARPTVVTAGRPRPVRGVDHCRDDLGEAGHRVAPEIHRESTGVVGSTTQLHLIVPEPGDAGHHRDRQSGLFEDRPLLDVELNEAVDVVAGGARRSFRGQVRPFA